MMDIEDFFNTGNKLEWFDDKYKNKIEFTESGIYTNTTGKVQTIVIGICGGGAGGGNSAYAGGGGGSGMTYHKITLQPGETVVVTIGAGGLSGNDGGDSSFGSYVTVKGGKTPVGGDYNVGKGENGGTDGFSTGTIASTASPLTLSKIVDGVPVFKLINPHSYVYNQYNGQGGMGGGYDYEGVGAGDNEEATGYGSGGSGKPSPFGDGRDGICVVWFNGNEEE